MAKRKSRSKGSSTGRKSGKGKYKFTHLTKVNIRNVFVHSLKVQ